MIAFPDEPAMLIQLLQPTHPTILVPITYQDLPDDLDDPLAWRTLFSSISVDNLDPPEVTHALDKATWVSSILQEISFNVATSTVSCLFIDGICEEWRLVSPACLKALNSVFSDMYLCSEILREHPATASSSYHNQASTAPITPAPSPPPYVEPSVQIRLELPSLTSLSPEALRRRAHSTLVDIFRRHVLSDLKTRLPEEGYYTWIIQSMLRRSSDAMDRIISQTRIQSADQCYSSRPMPLLSPLNPGDDDANTATDVRSIQTPSTTTHLASSPVNSPSDTPCLENLSPADVYEYKSLTATCSRLRSLLVIADAQKENRTNEAKQGGDALEIRTRRRAWSNKALQVRWVRDMDVLLATPHTSSLLRQRMWAAEEYSDIPTSSEAEVEMSDEYDE